MSLRIACLACLGCLPVVYGPAQEIPEGVRYKKATAEVNAKAQAVLRKLLNVQVPDKTILASVDKVVVCGPSYWRVIRKAAPKSLQKAGKVTYMVPTASGAVKLEGRFCKTPDQKKQLWLTVLVFHNRYKKATIRKAKSDEISYYWALIPYDIEEPLLVADYGKARLLIHFSMVKGEPRVFFVDFSP